MGVLGLRRFLDASSCALTWGDTPIRYDHVLIDMNCLVHAAYSPDHHSSQQTMAAVLVILDEVLSLVVPKVSLTIAFDGPAPFAKLPTQRLRRRRAKHFDVANGENFSDLAVTTGSQFLEDVSRAVCAHLQQNKTLQSLLVEVSGPSVIGEGETKIARALSRIPALGSPIFHGNQSVAIVGNDVDLVLTALGATFFYNLFVLSPTTKTGFAVGEVLYRWLVPSAGGFVSLEELSGPRIDFVFLFHLNGGDHYIGLGDAATDLWRRYRALPRRGEVGHGDSDQKDAADEHGPLLGAAASPRIVGRGLGSMNATTLATVLGVDSSQQQLHVGTMSPTDRAAMQAAGADLLRSALWATWAAVIGQCSDYTYVAENAAPTVSQLRAALAAVVAVDATPRAPSAKKRSRYNVQGDSKPSISLSLPVSSEVPLTPLETFVALMPTPETLPLAPREKLSSEPELKRTFFAAQAPRDIAKLTRELCASCDEAKWTEQENRLHRFRRSELLTPSAQKLLGRLRGATDPSRPRIPRCVAFWNPFLPATVVLEADGVRRVWASRAAADAASTVVGDASVVGAGGSSKARRGVLRGRDGEGASEAAPRAKKASRVESHESDAPLWTHGAVAMNMEV